MAILFTQITRRTDDKIMTSNYSSDGLIIQNRDDLLESLREYVVNGSNIFMENKIYCEEESKRNGTRSKKFYITVKSGYILSTIADTRSTPETVEKYFGVIFQGFESQKVKNYSFDIELKKLTDTFNKNEIVIQYNLELEGIHSDLVSNLNLVINRGGDVSKLGTMAETLSYETKEISRKALMIRRRAMMNKIKVCVVIFLIVLFLVYILLLR